MHTFPIGVTITVFTVILNVYKEVSLETMETKEFRHVKYGQRLNMILIQLSMTIAVQNVCLSLDDSI